MAADPLVSVIIPAYNAQDTVADAIEAVRAQDYAGPVELVVVDDGSTDATAAVVRRYTGVVHVRQENAGPASARNHGARVARGDILFFTDSDCRPERAWVSKMIKGFAREGVSVVAGSYGIANAASPLARVIHAEIVFRHRSLMPEFPKAFGSYNFAVRRAVFEAAGGFNAQYRTASGEDNDLSYRIIARGGRILFCRDALVDHYHQESLARYLKEQFRHGFWRLKMYADHPGMMAGDGYTFWKDAAEIPLAMAHASLLFWPVPFVLLGAAFFLLEVVFGRVIMGSGLEMFFAGYVLWLRAFTRAAGFLVGGILFFKDRLLEVKKT